MNIHRNVRTILKIGNVCAEEMETTLTRYLTIYNHHVIHRNLDHLTLIQSMKQ
jgi:hypothetical protein